MNNYSKDSEVWKDVFEYEGYYQVSTHGRVRSVDRYSAGKSGSERLLTGRVLKNLDNKGYKMVNLHKSGGFKKVLVSRLVAMAFIDNPENKPEVNHIDEDKQNNAVTNLEWATSKENSNHGTRNKRISQYFVAHPEITKNGKPRGPVKGSGGARKLYKSVLQIDPHTNQIVAEFESVGKALVAVGAGPKSGGLSSCLTGNAKNKTFKGYKWEYKY